MGKDKEIKKNFLDKLYDWSASIDPLIPKDYQEGVDWWNPYAATPMGSYQNVITQGDPLKNTPIKALHEFSKKSHKALGLWSDEERLLRERIANEIKRKKEMYDKNPEQIHPRNIYSSAYQNGGLIKEAQNVASKGRYGDTMLMHVNPKEVEGLASIMPITINPETGQPEAFIGAILGSLLGGSFLPGLMGGSWLTAAGGAAIGSGLGTWAETGDLEKGIASAVMGYGVGSIMGDVATAEVGEMASQGYTQGALQQAGKTASEQAILQAQLAAQVQGTTLAPELAKQIGENASKQALQQGLSSSQLANVAKDTAGSRAFAYNQMTGGERLSNMGSNLFSTDTLDSMASNYLPIAIGGGSLGAQNAQDQYLEDMEQYRLDREKRRKQLLADNPEQIHRRNPYYSMYNSNAGGQIPSYANGEAVAGIGPEGQFTPSNTYMPGIDSEFNYFPNRVIPSSAISARQAAASQQAMAVMPNPRASMYQPMVLPDYEDPAAGSVLQRVNQARAAGLPATTQLLSPFRNVGLEGVTQAANPIAYDTTTGTGTNVDYDDDLTNNTGSVVTDNGNGTSTVTFVDGQTTVVANNPYTDPITVTSNTDPATGLELSEGDEGYVNPNSDEYSEATYNKGTGGGPSGLNPYLGNPATTYEQVEENKETVLNSAQETQTYGAYNAAIEAGIPDEDIVIAPDSHTVITDDTVIVGSTGYGKPGSLEDGTYVYTNTDPLVGIVESSDNFAPGEKKEATAGILISPDGTRTDITDLSTFENPGDGSVIELNNGYTVVNDPNNGVNNYARVGVYADDPSYGGLHERDPAVFAPQFTYQTLTTDQKNAAQDTYQQAVGDAIARGDIPAPEDALYPEGYEEYLDELEAETEAEATTTATKTIVNDKKSETSSSPIVTRPTAKQVISEPADAINIPESAQSVIDSLGQSIADSQVIPQLPPEIIPQLPPEKIMEIIPQLPPEVIPQVIAQLPPEVIPQVIPQLPPEVIQQVIPQIPPEIIPQVITQLPPEVIQQVIPQIPPEIVQQLPPEIVADPVTAAVNTAVGKGKLPSISPPAGESPIVPIPNASPVTPEQEALIAEMTQPRSVAEAPVLAPVPVATERVDAPEIEQVEQIKQIMPQLPVEVIKEIIPDLPPQVIKEIIPELPVEVIKQVVPELPPQVIKQVVSVLPVQIIQEIIPQLPVEVIQEVIPELPQEAIQAITLSTPEAFAPLPMMQPTVQQSVGRNFRQSMRDNRNTMAEGGLIEMQAGMEIPSVEQIPPQQELQEQVVAAVLGQHPDPDSVIQAFIQQFGVDAFLQLRDSILKQQVPNAQTEGMIQGQGGGMDDLVMGQIGNQSAVAVSPGEYIVPADVVSMLGDGSSNNGSDKLDDMLSEVRMTKTGTKNQAKPFGNKRIMAI